MKDIENLKELAANLPDTVKGNATALVELMGTVIEGIGDTPIEWRPDILKILQGTSDRSKYAKTTPIGAMIVGEEVLTQPVDVYPIRLWGSRQYWSPDQNEAKMLCSSPNGEMGYLGYKCSECPHAVWKEEGGSDCSKVWQVAVITADLSKFFIVNFSKTAYVNGTAWKGQMTKAMAKPYERVYSLSTETHKQYKNVEALMVTPYAPSEKKTPQEVLGFLKALAERFESDRNEHIKSFNELATKKGLTIQAKLADAGKDVAALPASVSTEPETVVVEAAPTTDGQKSMSKKYSI